MQPGEGWELLTQPLLGQEMQLAKSSLTLIHIYWASLSATSSQSINSVCKGRGRSQQLETKAFESSEQKASPQIITSMHFVFKKKLPGCVCTSLT